MRQSPFRKAAFAAVLILSGVFIARAQTGVSPRSAVDDVKKADETYRVAKLHRDVPALDRILASQFSETNQNGNSRNKAETLDLWKTFSISSLTTDSQVVRVDGNTATVTGEQTEDAADRMLFMRVYVKRPNGWQLLSSMQFRNPKNLSASIERSLRSLSQ